MEDPVTVLYRLRAESLKTKTRSLPFRVSRRQPCMYAQSIGYLEHGQLGAIEVQQYHLFSSHSGSVAQRGNMTMAFTTDPHGYQ